MTQKKDESTTGALSLKLNCRTCIHLEKLPCPGYGGKKTCAKLGTLGSAKACKFYALDVMQVVDVRHDIVHALASIAEELNGKQLQGLAYTIRNMEQIAKAGYAWGQQVFFCIGADYLQNYFQGVIINVSPDGQHIHISSSLKHDENYTLISLMPSSLLTPAKFEKRKKRLIKLERVVEPRRNGRLTLMDELQMTKAELQTYRQSLATTPEEYVPPTMDSVPQHWLDKRKPISFKEDAVAEVKAAKTAHKSKTIKYNANGTISINRRSS